ncbi:hypothetical protein GCM10010191_79600 [Actinomadura vinacea]|uniref:SH3 domain-containing protein n=1 Tax=Actinomadura vinacea TaxID=115336 RepID=A0ABN3K594_9ACTN
MCGAPLPEASAAGGEVTVSAEKAEVLLKGDSEGGFAAVFEDDPTLVETRFADIPPAQPGPFAPPGAASRGRGLPGFAGWAVAGVFALALVAVLIVLWPSGRSGEGTATGTGGRDGSSPSRQVPPSTVLSSTPVGDQRFYVDTFAAAEGYARPDTSGGAVGELRKGTHYVFCKKQGQRMDRKGGEAYNHWWLLTDLDVVYGGGGARAWVPALYLSRWGNDEVKDNDGRDIPACS